MARTASPAILDQLTPKQRQVLRMIADGRTNPEIATAMGVTIDGAKWHVSEIISKLGVVSREEATAIWREEHRLPVRARRAFAHLVPGAPWAKVLVGGAGVGGALIVAIVAVLALRSSGSSGSEPPAASDATSTATATLTAGQPSTATATAPATSTLPPVTGVTPTGTVTEAPPSPPSAPDTPVPGGPGGDATPRPLTLSPAAYTWPDHDRESTVLYDTLTGGYRDFGPGFAGAFSPDESKMGWIANDELWVVDLPDGEPRMLGPAGTVQVAMTNTTATVRAPGSGSVVIEYDVATGASREAMAPFPSGGPYVDRDFVMTADSGASSGLAGQFARKHTITAAGSGAVLYEFWASTAIFAGAGEVAYVTPPDDGHSEVRLLDLASGAESTVANVVVGIGSIPLRANERWVAWTDNFCGMIATEWGPRGTTKAYERASGDIFDLGDAFWFDDFTPDGRLGLGGFGADRLIDLETGVIEVELPPGATDIEWSAGYRYASRGAVLGHGGHCPP